MFKKNKEIFLEKLIKSGIFDEIYYLTHSHEARISTLEPIEHYSQIGIKENRNPNESFDVLWYLKNYEDITRENVNPVLHFIEFGEKENRFLNKQEKLEYNLIKSNKLFDVKYYKQAYKDMQDKETRFDCLLHFVRIGAVEGRNPNAKFDLLAYKEKYISSYQIDENPLVHYIKNKNKNIDIDKVSSKSQNIVRANNKEVHSKEKPLSEKILNYIAKSKHLGGTNNNSIIVYSKSKPLHIKKPKWIRSTYFNQTKQDNSLDLCGQIIGFSKIKRDDTLNLNINIFSKMMQLPLKDTLENHIPNSEYSCSFDFKDIIIADAYFINKMDLRLKINFLQENQISKHVVRAYQYDILEENLVVVCESLLTNQSMKHIDLGLINPYMPILLTQSSLSGVINNSTLIAFPSLIRNNIHDLELRSIGNYTNNINALANITTDLVKEYLLSIDRYENWCATKIYVDTKQALGSEEIFSMNFNSWLNIVMRLNVYEYKESNYIKSIFNTQMKNLPLENSKIEIDKREKINSQEIILPSDSIPSLQLLVSNNKHGIFSNTFIITENNSQSGKQITLPRTFTSNTIDIDTILPHPIIVNANTKKINYHKLPIAIVKRSNTFREIPTLIKPISPDLTDIYKNKNRFSIGVVLLFETCDIDNLKLTIKSLKLQINSEITVFLPQRLLDQNETIIKFLNTSFNNKVVIIDQSIQKIGTCEYILLLEKYTLFHDNRTLEILSNIVKQDTVSSVSCMSLEANKDKQALVEFHSAGKSFVKDLQTETFKLQNTPNHTLFARASFPVATNQDFALMVSKEFNKLGGSNLLTNGSFRLQDFSLKALENKFFNICTTLVSVERLKGKSNSIKDESIELTTLSSSIENYSMVLKEIQK